MWNVLLTQMYRPAFVIDLRRMIWAKTNNFCHRTIDKRVYGESLRALIYPRTLAAILKKQKAK